MGFSNWILASANLVAQNAMSYNGQACVERYGICLESCIVSLHG